jgi:hypothetical protein
MRAFAITGSLALAAMLGACGSGESDSAGPAAAGSHQTMRSEAACTEQGLDAPKRQTIILVDARAIQKTADATDFAVRNTAFRDLILTIADPEKGLSGGLSVPRERVTIAVVPSDGSAADIAFTGCIPGLSQDEKAAAMSKQSAASSVFSSGVAGELEKQAEAFRTQLIGGLVGAAARANGIPSAESVPIAQSHFLQGVRASRSVWDSKEAVTRLILVSDVSALTMADEHAKTSAFDQGAAAGRSAGGDLGLSEVHIVLPAERPIPDQSFLRGYFLAQNGALASTAVGRIAASPPPPRRLWRFAGEAAYPSGAAPLEVRLGDDGNGKLVSSWMTVLGEPRFAIPMTGQIACSSTESCKIGSDNGGFAQAWSGAAPDAPRFAGDLPFGGMRNVALEIAGTKLSGRVADDGVMVGKDPGQTWIEVQATTKQF